jgi:hypothetical protein
VITPDNLMVWAWAIGGASVALLLVVIVLDVAVLRTFAPRSTKVVIAVAWAWMFAQSPIWAGWLG